MALSSVGDGVAAADGVAVAVGVGIGLAVGLGVAVTPGVEVRVPACGPAEAQPASSSATPTSHAVRSDVRQRQLSTNSS